MIQQFVMPALLREGFIAGTDEAKDMSLFLRRLWKLEGGAIHFCLQGWAQVTINLKEYEVVENTQVIIMPGSIVRINGCSADFRSNYFGFPMDMFHEVSHHLEPTFFGFIRENPCYTLPVENTHAIKGLMNATAAIYADRDNRFRRQIAKNHLQCFLWEIYDKCHRYFSRQEIEGRSRQDELFKRFVELVHEYCVSEREVTFYADKLCISTKYLTGICRSVTEKSAKQIIDEFSILEIKVLLQSSGATIQEIADRLNFPDQSYLGRFFKRHEGISPREYQSKFSV